MNLNPFKKRDAALKRKRQEQWAEDEAIVDVYIRQADAIVDPAEKVIALQAIEDKLHTMIYEEKRSITKETNKKSRRAGIYTMVPFFAGGVATAALFSGPVGWAGLGVVLSGEIAGDVVKVVRSKYVRKDLETSAEEHIDCLRDKITMVSDMTAASIRQHVPAIAKSPLRNDIMKNARLASIFAEAAINHVVAQEEEVIALKKAQEARKTAEEETGKPQAKKKDWQKLIGVMNAPPQPPSAEKPRAGKTGTGKTPAKRAPRAKKTGPKPEGQQK